MEECLYCRGDECTKCKGKGEYIHYCSIPHWGPEGKNGRCDECLDWNATDAIKSTREERQKALEERAEAAEKRDKAWREANPSKS